MSALKNFGITFLISALIFGICAYFLVGFLTTTVDGILNGENEELEHLITEEPPQTAENPDKRIVPDVEGSSFTVLFGVTDERPEIYKYYPDTSESINAIDTKGDTMGTLSKYTNVKVKSIVLARFCKETGECTLISIPSITRVYTQMGGGSTLLEDVNSFYDKEYFVSKVFALTGIKPDYSVIVNVTELTEVLNAIGTFTVYLPEDIYSDGKNYVTAPPETEETSETTVTTTVTTTAKKNDKDKKKETDETDTEEPETTVTEIVYEKAVKAGNVTVTSGDLEAMILFENYADNGKTRCELLADIVKGFLEKLSQMDDDSLYWVYTALADDEIDTDMTSEQFIAKGNILRALGSYETTVMTYPGSYYPDTHSFKPDVLAATKDYMPLRMPADPLKN